VVEANARSNQVAPGIRLVVVPSGAAHRMPITKTAVDVSHAGGRLATRRSNFRSQDLLQKFLQITAENNSGPVSLRGRPTLNCYFYGRGGRI
jgi:hypothetical protein